MRYVVYGAGAVGGTIAARLFEAGHEMILIARGAHLEALKSGGLSYSDPTGSRVLPIPAVGHPAAVEWRGGEVTMLAMKSQATEDALRDLVAVAPQSIAVVCAQNGVANERAALRRFPNVYGMCVMMPASHLEPGAVDADSFPIVGVLDLGRYREGTDDVARQIASDLSASGFRSDADPSVMRWKYEKMLLNLTTAVRAMCGQEAVDCEEDARLRGILAERLRREALACFEREGVALPTPEERSARWDGALTPRPITGRPKVAGSAWQSLARRTGTIETDYINGEITLLGRLHGIPTPVNELVQRRANDLARLSSPPGSLPLKDLVAAAGADRPHS
jgi:2-dehydropantoate 2-reductase